jgi:hypothetical protein
MPSNHVTLYSHGFAVDKESRGLFKDIVTSMPTVRHELVDLNEMRNEGHYIYVRPINEQTDILKRKLADLFTTLPDNTRLDMVCHSLGCLTAALAVESGVHRIILVSPPFDISIEHMKKAFADHPGVTLDIDGDSVFVRKDGVTAVVPREYWLSIMNIYPRHLYEQLANKTDVRIIFAAQDKQREPNQITPSISGAREYGLDGDHNFTHLSRQTLVATVKSLLTECS